MPAMTVADLLNQPPLMPIWPDFGRDVCRQSASSTYRLAAQDRLPVPVVRIGGSPEDGRRGRRFVRTADVIAWLHLTDVAAALSNDRSKAERPPGSRPAA